MQAPYSPSPTHAQQPVRVRLSCDLCSAAKVKCDKRRPACERCSSNQLHCTYSVSRRHGCKRRIACNPAVTTPEAANIPQSSRGDGGSPASTTRSQGRDIIGLPTYDSNELSESCTTNESINFHNGNDLPNPFQYLAENDFTTNVDMDGLKGSAFAFDNPLPTPYEPSPNAYLPQSQQEPGQAAWTPTTTPSTTSVHTEDLRNSEYNVALPITSKAIADALNRSIDSHKNPNLATSNETTQEVHDCEAYALTLLRSLHHSPLYFPDKDNQISSSHQACAVSERYLTNNNTNPEVLHSLDTILDANKCALSGVMKLLDCSCAQRPHLASLYIAIITKMLSLYEIAATTDISSRDCTNSAPPSGAHKLCGPRLARTTAIQVGVFDLDEEDRATLQRGILLRQIRNMERPIEKFASLSAGDANNHDISVRQWHGVAVSMIKKELQRVYQNCLSEILIHDCAPKSTRPRGQ